ncbi:hypothetical protein [Desulfosporosinus youngiae]|uniref:hypothetical protein n=1 Tax=Desulfosporosinus youngiae TaxID=339862 RepID=UPI0005AA719A|nr:hypothetical protein [Desulfosporosinus youngiae]
MSLGSFFRVNAYAAAAASSEDEKDSTKPYQPPPKVLLTFPTNWLKERLSAKRMRQWSRAKASADGSRPRSAPQVHMQKYPEVRTRSRIVQRASGGTRRRVQISAPPQSQAVEPTSCLTQEAFFRVAA